MRSWLLWLTLAPIALHVYPTIAFAPATIRLQVRHTPEASDRILRVIADGANYYRSSEVTLDGLHAHVLDDFELRDIPAGHYEILATVESWTTVRASARARVEVQ